MGETIGPERLKPGMLTAQDILGDALTDHGRDLKPMVGKSCRQIKAWRTATADKGVPIGRLGFGTGPDTPHRQP